MLGTEEKVLLCSQHALPNLFEAAVRQGLEDVVEEAREGWSALTLHCHPLACGVTVSKRARR